MSHVRKILWIQAWFFFGMPFLGWILGLALGTFGLFLYAFLFALWCWELFAQAHYRHCRQEELVHVLQTAAATRAPLEAVLTAYLQDRPQGSVYRLWVISLLFFVFPGYYFIHLKASFDSRLHRLVQLLCAGYALDRALGLVPGVVSRQTALAVAVGQFTGQLPHALQRLPERRVPQQWLELGPRFLYPLMVLGVLVTNVSFVLIFVIPKFEKIFYDFHLRLPPATTAFLEAGRLLSAYVWLVPALWLLLVILVNVLIFSSRAKWHFPLVGGLYRLHARGQFLQTLGIMLETGKPLPEILERLNASGLLPTAVRGRANRLAADLTQGQPLPASLVRCGLATASMRPLIESAQRAQNLPWALHELGDTLARRSARNSHRIAMVLFPLTIFACAALVAGVAVALFSPLVALMESLHYR